jgi:hypothetical protein
MRRTEKRKNSSSARHCDQIRFRFHTAWVTSGGLGPTLRRQVDPRQRTPPAARVASGSARARSRCAPARCAGGMNRRACSQHPDASRHIKPTDNAITKLPRRIAPICLLERVAYISARKKLIHAMSLNADRPINRAMVAGCAISATRNYLKLHMPRTLNPLAIIPHLTRCSESWNFILRQSNAARREVRADSGRGEAARVGGAPCWRARLGPQFSCAFQSASMPIFGLTANVRLAAGVSIPSNLAGANGRPGTGWSNS